MDTHYKSLYSRIYKIITTKLGLECVMRTRISSGYKIGGFITPVLISNQDLMVMSNLDEDQSYTVTLELRDKSNTETSSVNNPYEKERDNFLFIQSALLYTHLDGTRRIRIHNLCLPITRKVSEIHDSLDSESMASLYMKQLIDKIYKSKKIVNSVLSIENQLKSLISSAFASKHSLSKELPSNHEYLLLYFLGILKNRISCKDELSMKLDIDVTNYIRVKIQKMAEYEIINFIYPKFYQIHHLLLDNSIGNTDENGYCVLPEIISTMSKATESDGVYLVDNGFNLFLYVKLEINQSLLKSFFKVNSLNEISAAITEDLLFSNPDDYTQRLINIIEYIRSTKTFYQPLLVIFESTDSERL